MAKKKQGPKAEHQRGTNRSFAYQKQQLGTQLYEYATGHTSESMKRIKKARSQGRIAGGLEQEIKAARIIKNNGRPGEWMPNTKASTYDASNIQTWMPPLKVPKRMTGKSKISTNKVKTKKRIKK
jgi:hypothetical protein